MHTGINIGHASRIENGKRPPTEKVATACDAAFPDRKGWFTEYYEELRGWSEVPASFKSWPEYEDKAASLRDWSPSIMTGLLQTEDYARALLTTLPGASAGTVAARLASRMERQRRVLLRGGPPSAWFVVDELSLYRLVGSADTMATQLRHLLEVAATDDETVSALAMRFDSLRAECYRASESLRMTGRLAETWTSGVNPLTRTPTAGTA